MSAKKPIVSLNLNKFKEFVKSPLKDYSFVIMFTAMAPSRRCAICQAAYDEYQIVANSYRFSQAFTNKLFFGIVDFDEGSDIFQMVSTNQCTQELHNLVPPPSPFYQYEHVDKRLHGSVSLTLFTLPNYFPFNFLNYHGY